MLPLPQILARRLRHQLLLLQRCLRHTFSCFAVLFLFAYMVIMSVEQQQHQQRNRQQLDSIQLDTVTAADDQPPTVVSTATVPTKSRLYTGSASWLLHQLVQNPTTSTFELRNGTPVVWSYFDRHLPDVTRLPGFIKLSLTSAAANEPAGFVQVLATSETAASYLPDLHPAFAQLSEKSRELYFMGRILDRFGGFYLSPTSIFYRSFLKFLNRLQKTDACLVIHPKAKPSLVGPFRANSERLAKWKNHVHALLDRFMEDRLASSLQALDPGMPDELPIPTVVELDRVDKGLQRPSVCSGAHGRYALYISPRDLERQYGLNSTVEQVLSSTSSTEFSTQFKACCVWQSDQERALVFQLREVQTPFE